MASHDLAAWQAAHRSLERAGRWLQARPLAADSLLAAAVAGPFAIWSLSHIVAGVSPSPLSIGSAVVVALAILMEVGAFAFRRVAPLASFAAVSAGLLVQSVVPGAPVLPSLVVFPFSVYAYCAYGQARAPLIGIVVSLAGASVVTAQVALNGQAGQGGVPLPVLFGTVFAVALVGWSLGLFRRIQLAYVAALEERAARVESEREEQARRAASEERARIAREMHDVVAHSLAVIVSQAQGGQYAVRSEPERAGDVLATIAEVGRQSLTDLRGMLGVLRSDAPAADDDSHGWGPQPILADLPALLQRVRDAGLPVQYVESGTARRLGPVAELALYRVVQEALTNTLKHAGGGAEATVRFAWDERALTTIVSDNGRGPGQSPGAGHGLIGMRERLACVGGSVEAGPRPEGGFVVRACLPFRANVGAGVRP